MRTSEVDFATELIMILLDKFDILTGGKYSEQIKMEAAKTFNRLMGLYESHLAKNHHLNNRISDFVIQQINKPSNIEGRLYLLDSTRKLNV